MIPPDLDAAFRKLSGFDDNEERRQRMDAWKAKLRQTCEPMRYGHAEYRGSGAFDQEAWAAHCREAILGDQQKQNRTRPETPHWIHPAQEAEQKQSFYYQALRDSVKNYQYPMDQGKKLEAVRGQCPNCTKVIFVCTGVGEFVCECGQKLRAK